MAQQTDTTTGTGPLAATPAIANLTTTDLDRSKTFWTQTVGLPLAMEMGGNAFMLDCGGGTHIFVYIREEAPKAENTVVSFMVDDVEKTVGQLRDRGVTFEEYDTPQIKTEDGVARDDHGGAAWFKDPDGNIVGLYETRSGS